MKSNTLYKKYLQSDEWKVKAEACKKLADYKCNRCDEVTKLQAHHKTYDRVGEELQEDLECLCEMCHNKEHNISGKLQTNDRYYSIKNLTTRVNIMNLLDIVATTCKSPKDTTILNQLLEMSDDTSRIRIDNVTSLAKELGVSRSKLNAILLAQVNGGLFKKLSQGVYFVNPFIFIGRRVTSNKKREALQTEWTTS